MKKLVCLLLFWTALSCALAQEDNNEKKIDWRQELPRHEIGLGYGDPLFALIYSPLMYGYDPAIDHNSPEDLWFNHHFNYYSSFYSTCPLSFHYLYRVTKFLWLGGHFSYNGIYARRYDYQNDLPIGMRREHYLTLMPSIRFSYLNKNYVTLYSGLATGVVGRLIFDTFNEFSIRPTFQMTFIGVTVGKKWYGFTELGCGMNGIIRGGFGYHFNDYGR